MWVGVNGTECKLRFFPLVMRRRVLAGQGVNSQGQERFPLREVSRSFWMPRAQL